MYQLNDKEIEKYWKDGFLYPIILFSEQEAFNLRSTVAVLGFALRTLGQMLEDGKLDSLISEYRSQNPNAYRDQTESNGRNFHPNNPRKSVIIIRKAI